jgi:hypothetical protein
MKTLWLAVLMLGAGFISRAEEPPAPPQRPTAPVADEQKAQLEKRLDETWKNLPLESKRNVLHLHRALTQLPPEERKFIHDRIERFLTMTPEEKQRIKENAERWKNMSADERQKAREAFRQQRHELEEKWRRDHPGEELPPLFHHRGPPPATNAPAPAVREKL